MKHCAAIIPLILIAGALAGLLPVGSMNASGSTSVSGIISVDTTWDLTGSPYIVLGDVTVADGITLTIEPGVQVRFDGYYGIYINGTLIAIGTEASRIVFTSNYKWPEAGDWLNIYIRSTGYADIRYCDISYGKHNIYVHGSSHNIIANNNIFYGKSMGLYIRSSSNNNVNNNTIFNSGAGIGDALMLSSSWNNTISHNDISNNEVGIVVASSSNNLIENNHVYNNRRDGVILSLSWNNTVANNYIIENSRYGILLDSSQNNDVIDNNISMNYWGGIHLESSFSNLMNNNEIYLNHNTALRFVLSSNNAIIRNNVHSNFGYGINFLTNSNYNTVIDNNISNNTFGIQLYLSSLASIANNTFFHNGLVIGGTQLSHFNSHEIAINNTVNSKPLAFLKDSSKIDINGLALGQLIVMNCTDVRISNLEIINTDIGIEIAYSNKINVTSNRIANNSYGISIISSSKNIVSNNGVISNNWNGITLLLSSNNDIIFNNVSSNNQGILISESVDNKIEGNMVASSNEIGIYMESSSDNNISNNDISFNNGDGIKVKSSSHNNILSSRVAQNLKDGVILESSSHNNITYNNISSNNGNGIYLESASHNNISGSKISSNYVGVFLKFSACNIVTNNTIELNEVYGLYLSSITLPSKDNFITFNNISSNYWGIILSTSLRNRIYYNNMLDNINQAYDYTSSNLWNSSYPSGGNHWSDWISPDLFNGPNQNVSGSDGIVDNHYIININSRDYYPLINPVEISYPSDTVPPKIVNLEPPNGLITNNRSLRIQANYSDSWGIKMNSIVLVVDGINVTSKSAITSHGITYSPTEPFADGFHSIYLEIRDVFDNLATELWSFRIDTLSPIIFNSMPMDSSLLNNATPTISANYSDQSGIDVGNALLKIDDANITMSANIGENGIEYLSPERLSEGFHTIYIEVKDKVGNLATRYWNFSIDTSAPIISNMQPSENSSINDNNPQISANFSDASQINMGLVYLRVDSINVTSLAAITTYGISYTSDTMELADGYHFIDLEVRDILGNQAISTWSFNVDTTPPTTSNLQPPASFTTDDSIPLISAEYSDPSGIEASSVLLKVDGVDVTSISTVAAKSVLYYPPLPLVDGLHNAYLEVADTLGNLATRTWFFTVAVPDAEPPTISNLQPPDRSTTYENTLMLSAEYSDNLGINPGSVLMLVDGSDVTSWATITASDVKYVQISRFTDGAHFIYLEVKDFAGNLAKTSWSFNVDTRPPTIVYAYLQPSDGSTTEDNTPIILAAYSDEFGIDTSNVVLKVDGIDVTSLATVTEHYVDYFPSQTLEDGIHVAFLEVRDANGNLAVMKWTFYVDTTGTRDQQKIPLGSIAVMLIFGLVILYLLLMSKGLRPTERVPRRSRKNRTRK
jgi:parallel beta-helix repeat protein